MDRENQDPKNVNLILMLNFVELKKKFNPTAHIASFRNQLIKVRLIST